MKGRLVFALAILAGAAWSAVSTASAQQPPTAITPPPPHPGIASLTPPPPPPAAQPKLLDLLQWDAILKEQTPLPGQATADFIFGVTNPSDSDVVIDRVQTSCGCTVAKLPSTPWVLTPHTNGNLAVSVNLAGKSGTFFKTITVISTNASKVLTIKVSMPESPAMMRANNQRIAFGDQQAVFKGDCAKCHVDKAKGLMGKQLYVAACGICHDANPRATMVTDLHHLKHPTSYAYWQQIITDGKPRTLMPAFGTEHGGPLSEDQINSLAKVLVQAFPPDLSAPPPQTSMAKPRPGFLPMPVKN